MTKKFIKTFMIALALTIFASIYFSCIINTAASSNGVSIGPIGIIKAINEIGFPFPIFNVILIIFFILYIAGFYFYYAKAAGKDKLGRNIRISQDSRTYGDAHFEEPEEYEGVAVVGPIEKTKGTILGQLDESGNKVISMKLGSSNHLNQNIAIVGASGAGKTFSFVKPYCYQTIKRRESIIITDPDGGLYRDMAQLFKDKGYVVRRLDLKHPEKSDGWHCLKSIDTSFPEVAAQLFAQTAISNAITESSESVYAQGSISLLKALILRVFLGDDFPEEKKTIDTVYKILENPGGEDYLEALFNLDIMPKAAKPCYGAYRIYKRGSENLRSNICTNLGTYLQLFQTDVVSKLLSTDDIDLELPGKQPCAYFCLFPDTHDTFKFIISLFFSMLFIKLVDYADNQDDGKLPIPVNFLLDEFPSIGVIPDWEKKMATMRKRRMSATMIFQDLTQLQNNYKSTWVTILTNCSAWITLGINDMESADLFSKRSGPTTVNVRTTQHPSGKQIMDINPSYTEGEGKIDLLSLAEVFKVGGNDSIIVFQHRNPVYAKKFPHTLHPLSKEAKTILPKNIPNIYEEEKRKKIREKEDAYIKKYLKKYPLDKVDRSYSDPEPEEEKTILEILKEKTKKKEKLTEEEKLLNEEYEITIIEEEEETIEEIKIEETLNCDDSADNNINGDESEKEAEDDEEVDFDISLDIELEANINVNAEFLKSDDKSIDELTKKGSKSKSEPQTFSDLQNSMEVKAVTAAKEKSKQNNFPGYKFSSNINKPDNN